MCRKGTNAVQASVGPPRYSSPQPLCAPCGAALAPLTCPPSMHPQEDRLDTMSDGSSGKPSLAPAAFAPGMFRVTHLGYCLSSPLPFNYLERPQLFDCGGHLEFLVLGSS